MRIILGVLALSSMLAVPMNASAQTTPADDVAVQQLRELVSERGAMDDDRQVIDEFLAQPQMETIAEGSGVDLDRARDRARALDDDTVSDLATWIRDAASDEEAGDRSLVGGDAIVISSTAVIIGLLILILIAVD
jgi:hypothetical protein